MSTVAYDGKTIAADSQGTTSGGIEPVPFKKIWRIKKHAQWTLAGGVGDYDACVTFVKWVMAGCCEKMPEANLDDVVLFTVDKKFRLQIIGSQGFPILTIKTPYAMGSGGDYALAAMICGKTAREAVKVAIQLDANSGGRIVSYGAKL
jgi:hypothetical protein